MPTKEQAEAMRSKLTTRGWNRDKGKGESGSPMGSANVIDPFVRARKLGVAITAALDPVQAPGRVRAFKDMSPEEQAEMRKKYEKKM